MRGLVVEDSGEHRGQLDIKHGGLLPVTDLARYGSLAAGARALATPERLRVASIAGVLDSADARVLTEAFDLFWRLRLEHQVEQLRGGADPDDYLDPEQLNPLTRTYLRDAFHAIRAMQRRFENELAWSG
jgi:CBS domain-containing protein